MPFLLAWRRDANLFARAREIKQKGPKSLHCSIDEIKRDVAHLKRTFQVGLRQKRRAKKRYAIYDYLYEVYDLSRRWYNKFRTSQVKDRLLSFAVRTVHAQRDRPRLGRDG